jgi:amino acid permease
MTLRLFDGSYQKGGRFFREILVKPSFEQRGGYTLLSARIFVLLSMLSKSFIAHYNAPRFFNELRDNTMPRFNTVVISGYMISMFVNILIMSVGFLTFGGSSQGFALNNYAASDHLATLARFAIGLALITGFPFTFFSLRDNVMDFRNLTGEAREASTRITTVAMLSMVTALALFLKDVGFVVSISGALFGCSVMFVLPMIMNLSSNRKLLQKAGISSSPSLSSFEIAGNYVMITTGIAMSVIGVAVSVLKQLGKLK